MPKFAGLSVCSTWAAAGGTPVREVARLALLECKAQRTVGAPDQNRLDVGVRRTWDGLSEMTSRRVLRVTFTNGAFDEWRINTQQKATSGKTLVKQFACLPPIFMLAECGEYYTTGAGGIRDFSYSLIGVTASQAVTSLVLGTPGIPGFVGLGTVDAAIDAVTIDIESTDEGMTPLAILLQIAEAVRAKGVRCELDYRRVGTTSYVIDLVTQVGAGAAVPEFAAGKNLLDYLLTADCTRQTTRVRPKGPVDATGLAARLSRARFKVTAVNGGTKRVTLADEAGGAGPIQFDEQYVGWFTFREKTGRSYQILHSYQATQELELADVSSMAAHSVTAPEWLSFRESENLAGTRRHGMSSAYDTTVLECTGVAGSVLTLRTYIDASDWLDTDQRFVDWLAERATFVMATAAGTSVTDRFDCVSAVTSVQIGDVVLASNSTTHPYALLKPVGTVTAIDTGLKHLSVARRYASGAVTTGVTSGLQLRIYRPVATAHRITASAAAANTATVDAPGTAANTDVLLRLYQPCQGILPIWVESPADVAAYDVKHSVLGVTDSGECTLFPNAYMRTWTGGAAVAADGWTWTGTGAATITRLAGPAYHGSYAASCILYTSSGAASGVLRTPPGFVHPVPGALLASVRARLTVTQFTANGGSPSSVTLKLYKQTPGGTRTQLGTVSMLSNATALNTPIDLSVVGCDLSTIVDESLVAEISSSASTANIIVVVDAIQITQTATAPRPYPERLIEHSEGTKLLQRANLELVEWAPPPKEFRATIADFARVDPAKYGADDITLGGYLRLFDTTEVVDETVRCLSLGENYLKDAETTLTIAVLPPRLTSLVTLGSAA